MTDTAQDRQINLYNAPAQIGDRHHPQVAGTDGDQLSVLCEKLHHQPGCEQCKGRENQSDQDGKAQCDPLHDADGLQILFAPVLCAEHGGSGAKSVIDHKQNIGIVGRKGDGGDG